MAEPITAGPACPLCGSPRTRVFLVHRNVPVHQNRLFDSEAGARAATRGDLTMTVCDACEFVFNATFDPQKVEYDEEYDNCQICSPFFESYVDELVRHIVEDRGVRGKRIAEIGCGKGYFLRKLVESDSGNIGVGFDTTYEGPASDLDGRLTFRREFYGGQELVPQPDVVVCRHVIEHVPDPARMLRAVRASLTPESNALVFFETPALEWILDNEVVWDFFYEHCSLFTASSLARAFRASGFTVTGVQHVFGGQYLWLEARPAVVAKLGEQASAAVPDQCVEFGVRTRESIARLRSALATGKKAAVWGAGAKGVTFVNLIDPDRTLVDCVVDLNPRKQGRFIAGTGHPIVSPADLGTRRVEQVTLMNPNYEAENRRLLAELDLRVELLT